MIVWEEEGIIIGAKRHGEQSWICHVITKNQGRYAGLLRGSRSSKKPSFSRGCRVKARWSSRLSEQLGEWKLDTLHPLSFEIFNDYHALMAFDLICHYLRSFLPERSSYPVVYEAFKNLLQVMGHEGWLAHVAQFELKLLRELGFGLKLEACAVTGTTDDLAYVSPRSGCAVHRKVGEPYQERILILPSFLVSSHSPTPSDIRAAFRLTGFFLEKHFNEPLFASIFKMRHQWIESLWNTQNNR